MKQALWIVNNSIIVFFVLALITLQVLHQEPSPVTPLSIPDRSGTIKKKQAFPETHWEPIFKQDLFGTYTPRTIQPAQKNLVTPVPEIQNTQPQAIPEPKAPDFTPELTLTIKGIIIAADETQNVAMIEDETKKETVYHVGDLYKDGQIIKISRNSVVFLRSSGQQEAFYLRKEDADLAMDGPAKWEYIIKKLDGNTWQIDPESFKAEVDSLGNFLDRIGILGTAYQQGNPIGLRIGDLEKDSLGELLGLQQGDIITNINDLNMAQAPNRVTLFDKIAASNAGDVIMVSLTRNGAQVTQCYKLAYINKAKKMLFSENKPKDTVTPADDLKMNKMQEREKQMREFNERHNNNTPQQQDAISQIRKRLLENLRARLQNARARQ